MAVFVVTFVAAATVLLLPFLWRRRWRSISDEGGEWAADRGAIELSILADYYGREIVTYDIQTTRCDLYGQMSPFDRAPEEFDQTIFPVRSDRTIGPVEGLALNLVKEQHRKRSFTDTARFTLCCGVCQIGVVGQKEAVEHAQATGHVNFQEYR
ncbi:hypothetical protein Q3G72_031984 [Acer saccharum]|nr:hypothetical protein Q3G72_031984 [Acer saccharum]